MQTSYVFLADGFEEIEALSVVDIMRRAGMAVKTVSVKDTHIVSGAHGISVNADELFADCNFTDADWLIAPGGMPGAANLHQYKPLNNLLCAHKGHIAAICAAPAVVLAPLGLLKDKEATCYPGFEEQCVNEGAHMKDRRVVVYGNIVTANGPSSAMPFALAIVKEAMGPEVAEQVAAGMLADTY